MEKAGGSNVISFLNDAENEVEQVGDEMDDGEGQEMTWEVET